MRSRSVVLGVLTLLGAAAAAQNAAAAWAPVPCPEAAFNLEDRYERIRMVDDFEATALRWRALAGGQNAAVSLRRVPVDAAGAKEGHALRIDCRFTGKLPLEYGAVALPFKIEEKGLGLAFRVRNLSGHHPTLRYRVLDPSGECHQPNFQVLPDDKEWHFMTAAVDGPAGSWGGDGNGRVEYPVRFDSLVIDRPKKGFVGTVSLLVDDVALVHRRKPPASRLRIAVDPKRIGNVYVPDETFQVRVSAETGTVRWRVRDYWGRPVGNASGTTGPNGADTVIRRLARGPGYYTLTVENVLDKRVVDSRAFHFAVLPMPASPSRRDPFFGVQAHFHQRWNLRIMDLIDRLGAFGFRDEVTWSTVERQKGRLVIPGQHRAYRKRAGELGLDILVILDYGNRFYDNGGYPISPEAVEGYARYCRTIVDAWKPQVHNYEIWNEYTGGCGMSGKPKVQTPATYRRMLAAAEKAMRSALPEVTVVGIGGDHSGHHYKVIREKLAAGCLRYMDKLSVHSYRHGGTPEETDLVGELTRIHDLIAEFGGRQPIWITEMGWPTNVGMHGVPERTQARRLARMYILCKSLPFIERVYWYDFKNDGLDRSYHEHNFGMVRHDRYNWAVKPAAVAFAVLAQELGGAVPVSREQRNSLFACRFRRGDQDVIAAWSADSAAAQAPAGSIRVRGQITRVRDIMGRVVPVPPATNGTRVFSLTADPLYFTGHFKGGVELLSAAVPSVPR